MGAWERMPEHRSAVSVRRRLAGDEPHECVCGRSNSAAKKAGATLRISPGAARRSPLQPPDLRRLLTGDTGPLARIDLGLADPLAWRLRGPDVQLLGHRAD